MCENRWEERNKLAVVCMSSRGPDISSFEKLGYDVFESFYKTRPHIPEIYLPDHQRKDVSCSEVLEE